MLKWYNNINLGFILGNTMLVRADHPYYTADQITRHEIGHDMIAKGEVNVEAVRKKLVETTNKKETKSWFQSLGTQTLPLGGNKFGFVRSISQVDALVNTSKKNSIGKASIEFSSPEEAKESGEISDAKFSIEFADAIANNQRKYVADGLSRISSEELEKAIADTAHMVNEMKPYANILPQDKVGKTLVKNGSYDVSVENTTVCIRTLAYNNYYLIHKKLAIKAQNEKGIF